MLSKQLQEQIEQEAKAYANQFKYGAEYRKPAFADGAYMCATLYEAALARAERAEEALEAILNTNHDNHEKVILKVKQIATQALTPKIGEDE